MVFARDGTGRVGGMRSSRGKVRELRVLGPRAWERMSKGFAGLLRLRLCCQLPACAVSYYYCAVGGSVCARMGPLRHATHV